MTNIDSTDRFCLRLAAALDADSCEAIVERANKRGFASANQAYPPSYRTNDRLVLDDPLLAAQLFEVMRDKLPQRLRDTEGEWQLHSLNPRFRFCRYRKGQSFSVHRDGVHHQDDRHASRLTFMVYLSTTAPDQGGATRFFRDRAARAVERNERPLQGDLLVFDHNYWHDGEALRHGQKYVMRSDIIYRRLRDKPPARAHRGYVWSLLQRRHGQLVSASRDKTIGLWKVSAAGLERTATYRGHRASVYALHEHSSGSLWSGSRDGEIRIWREGKAPLTISSRGGAVLSLAEADHGEVLSGSADGWIRQWSRDGARVRAWRAHASWVWRLLRAGDLWSAGEDGCVSRWRDGHRLGSRDLAAGPIQALVNCSALAEPSLDAAGAEADAGVLACGAANGTIQLCRFTPTGASIEAPFAVIAAHDAPIRALATLPQQRLASAAEDDHVKVWCLRTQRCLADQKHRNFACALAALADGRLASASYDGSIRVWDDDALSATHGCNSSLPRNAANSRRISATPA